MRAEIYKLLYEMIGELKFELGEIESKIEQNALMIQGTDNYITSILEEESEDFRVFSPRSSYNIQKNEIDKSENEKKYYEEENNRLRIEKGKIQKKLDKVELILQKEKEADISILNIQEEDRQRIARDLHDTSLQNIAYLTHKVELSSMFIDQDPLRAKLELSVVNKHLKEVMEEIRGIIFGLRPMPFDDLGLKAAFERLLTVINEEKQFEIEASIEDVSCETNIVLATLYRAVQECLTNIRKHAEATKIVFHTGMKNGLYKITIIDNGKGFDEAVLEEKKNNHFGMTLIKERINLIGGKVIIDSEIDKGTKIEIEVPIRKV